VLTPRDLELLTGQRVLASLPNMGRRRRAILAEPKTVAEPRIAPAQAAPPKLSQPKLSQPKVAHDPILEWASGE
jgi:hypothetical protein